MSDTKLDETKTQEPISQDVTPTPKVPEVPNSTVTNDKHSTLLDTNLALEKVREKARMEEKQKLYERLSKTKIDRDKLKSENDTLVAEYTKVQKELQKLREEKAAFSQEEQAKMVDLEQKNKELEAKIEAVADVAAKRIRDSVRDSELKTYRANKIAEASIDPELIDVESILGSTEEEIDQAIERAKAKEVKIKEKAQEKVREELSKSVPMPLAPEGNTNAGYGNADIHDPARRREIARYGQKDRDEIREQLLRDAEKATGWKRNRPVGS